MAEMAPISDTKADNILLAAFDTFRTYGFRRTTMEDIARAAGMSRAALYLHFRNKEDIQRGMTKAYYEQVAERVQVALAHAGTVQELLSQAFAEHAGETFKILVDSPHGNELLDLQNSVSLDLTRAGQARVSGVYAEWLMREQKRGRVDLAQFNQSPSEVAEVMCLALYGLKSSNLSYERFVERRNLLAAAFSKAISP